MNEHGMLAISYQGVLQIMFNHTVFNSEFQGYSNAMQALFHTYRISLNNFRGH